MEKGLKYLKIASDALQIPLDVLKDAWSYGKDVRIPANTHLGVSYVYPNSSIFIHSGVIREYFVDAHGEERTTRFMQYPTMIAPPLNNEYTPKDTILYSQTLTPVKGRIWELSFMQNQAMKNPLFFRSVLAIICEAALKKHRNDIRLNVCSASERYLLFLKDFPGVVNEVPLKHVASFLKMSPETISRVRSELSK